MSTSTFEFNRTHRFCLGLLFCFAITASLDLYPWAMALDKSTVTFPLIYAVKPTVMAYLPACLIGYWVPSLEKFRLAVIPLISALCAIIYDCIIRPKGMFGVAQMIIIGVIVAGLAFFGILGEIALSARQAKRAREPKRKKVKRYSGPDI